MKTFYNHLHAQHQGKVEMFRGALVPCFEVPARADYVLAEVQRRQLGPVLPPQAFDDSALERIHSPRYLKFLATAWDQWVALDAANADKDILPSVWPTRTFRTDIEPDNFAAKVGLYSYDAGTPFTSGTWVAARKGAECALSAAQAVLSGDRAAFALSRPPGHHAGADFFGGYCFLNNAALAAQYLLDAGESAADGASGAAGSRVAIKKVAVLDVDYHHGNGTQAIFYDRPDVFFASIHGDPHTEYPFYLGHADERGAGAGLGANLNLPLPRGTDYAAWSVALETALAAITQFGADALVVSLGLDTFGGDPISGFQLTTDDYLRMGERLQRAGLPTVLVFEGGYATSDIGVNAANVLQAFA
jgi:acetoin utilization deacetylase AcuC-like enzyme